MHGPSSQKFALTTFLFLILLTCVAQAVGPGDHIEELAASGHIQEDAPVKASSEITIHAAPEKVWHLLTDIDNWPKWQSTISSAHINGAVEPGTRFSWTNGGAKIESRIAVVDPGMELVWTATAYKARAIHIWQLQPLPDGGTMVKTSESMNGFLLRVFYSSKDLAKSHKVWLEALKRKAEE